MAASNRNKCFFIVLLCFGAVSFIGFAVSYKKLASSVETIGRTQFGTVAIPVSNGMFIYARRESRGLNYDVLVLSPDPNPCANANPKTDYVLRYDGTPLYLSHSQNGITVYRYGSIEIPKLQSTSVTIDVKHLTFKEFSSVRDSYQKRNIERLQVPLTATLPHEDELHCW